MALEQDISRENLNVVGKEASTLSSLHGIANCVKNGAARTIVSPNRCQHIAAVLPTTTFTQV